MFMSDSSFLSRSFTFLIALALFYPSLSFSPCDSNRHFCRSILHSTTSNEQQRTTTSQCTTTDKQSKLSKTITGPPLETKPDYDKIHGPLGPLADQVFLSVFRTQMADKVGIDSKLPKNDYMGLIELAAAMNARYSDRRQVQTIAQDVLRTLFCFLCHIVCEST